MAVLRTGIAALDIQGNNFINSKELDHLGLLFFFPFSAL